MTDDQALAQRVRAVCLQALLQAYEDAGVQGLCAEGRWEAALGALQRLSPEQLLEKPATPGPTSA